MDDRILGQMSEIKGNDESENTCGIHSDISKLHDKLMGALIGLARATEGNEDLITETTNKVMMEGLSFAITNAECSCNEITELIQRVQEEKRKLVPNCFSCTASCGRNDDYDMQTLRTADKDIRALKFLILLTVQSIAVYAYRAATDGYTDNDVNDFLYKALFVVGMDRGKDELAAVVMESGEVNMKCMALFDRSREET